MDGSAGFPAAGLIVTKHLTAIRQENCARSRFKPKTDLALHGRLFPSVEEIVGGGPGSIDRQTPDLTGRQCRNGKIYRSVVGVEQEKQVRFCLPQNKTRECLLALVCPIGSGAVWREPLDFCIRVEILSS